MATDNHWTTYCAGSVSNMGDFQTLDWQQLLETLRSPSASDHKPLQDADYLFQHNNIPEKEIKPEPKINAGKRDASKKDKKGEAASSAAPLSPATKPDQPLGDPQFDKKLKLNFLPKPDTKPTTERQDKPAPSEVDYNWPYTAPTSLPVQPPLSQRCPQPTTSQQHPYRQPMVYQNLVSQYAQPPPSQQTGHPLVGHEYRQEITTQQHGQSSNVQYYGQQYKPVTSQRCCQPLGSEHCSWRQLPNHKQPYTQPLANHNNQKYVQPVVGQYAQPLPTHLLGQPLVSHLCPQPLANQQHPYSQPLANQSYVQPLVGQFPQPMSTQQTGHLMFSQGYNPVTSQQHILPLVNQQNGRPIQQRGQPWEVQYYGQQYTLMTSQQCWQPLVSQPHPYNQIQYMPVHPGQYVPQQAAVPHPAQLNQSIPESVSRPTWVANRELRCEVATETTMSSYSAAAPPAVCSSRNSPLDEDEKPYIKKPSNAFMVYIAEQRQRIMAELNIKNAATVNAVLGQRWNALSEEEKAKYFYRANMVRLHFQRLYPDWKPSDNIGRKKRLKTTNTAASTSGVLQVPTVQGTSTTSHPQTPQNNNNNNNSSNQCTRPSGVAPPFLN